MRVTGWKKAVQDVGERAAGVSRKVHRKIVIRACVQIVSALIAGLLKMDDEQTRKCRQALEEWDEEWQKKADDPEYVPEIDPEYKIRDGEAQFLSEIVPGVEEG